MIYFFTSFIKLIMKENFIKSTLILLVGGLITKILSMLIKIVMARILGPKGLGMYMLIIPTFTLLINLSQFGLPIALSKLISEENKNNKKLFFSILPILFIINTFLIITIIIFAPTISSKLLHNKDMYLSILTISLVIPFTSISSICRSYFFGKEKMFPHIISNISENLIRLILLIIILPHIIKYGLKYTVALIVFLNIISEIVSTILLLFFLPKNIKITKKDIIPNKYYILESLKISIPNTSGKLIGSIGYFLEPIILTEVLLKIGYSNNYIIHQYGIISGYVIPLLLLPSFFTLAISQALLPIVSREYSKNNKKYVYNKIKTTIYITLIVGTIITILYTVKPELFLQIFYKTTEGKNYMKILAPICLLQYIQSPLSFSLDAMGKSKDNFIITTISTIIRTLSLYILSYLKIGLYSLIISITLNILFTTIYSAKKIKYYLT